MVTLVKGDPKAPFSITTTPRCKGGRYSIPWIAPLYHIMLRVKQGGIKYHFWVFGITRPGIEPWSPGPLANALLFMYMARSASNWHKRNIRFSISDRFGLVLWHISHCRLLMPNPFYAYKKFYYKQFSLV